MRASETGVVRYKMNGHSFSRQVYIVNFIVASQTPKFFSAPAESLLIQRARPLTMRFFHHVDNGQGDVAFQRNFQAFHGDVTSFLESFTPVAWPPFQSA